MTLVRAVLVGVVIAAAMLLAVRHVPVEGQAAQAGISEDALRAYALRQAAMDKVKIEPPMPLPSLDPFPPDPPPVDPPAPPHSKPQPPKVDPPAPTMVAMRARPRIEGDLCARHGFHTVHYGRWRWRCRR